MPIHGVNVAFEAYAEALAQAEEVFSKAAAEGGWLEWTQSPAQSSIPPWWPVAAQYVFQVMKARIEDALNGRKPAPEIRYMCRVLTQAEVSYIYGRLSRYEQRIGKRVDRHKRAASFAHYVNRSVGRRLASILRRVLVEEGISNGVKDQSQVAARDDVPA